jgi:HD superfamily phosphodiesterase
MPDETTYSRIFDAARPYLQTRQNELHTRVCLRFARRLLQQEGGDPTIALPAVTLHDVGWSRVPEPLQLSAFGPNATNTELRDTHEREGAVISGDILVAVGYPSEKIGSIVDIVSRHDSRADAECLEEAIVKDADKLWRYSQEGFAIDVDRFETTAEAHLRRLAEALDAWFLTPAGAQIAQTELREREAEIWGCCQER